MSLLNLDKYPVLNTERLTLRALEKTDAQDVFGIRSNESINHYIKRTEYTKLSQAEEFIAKIKKGYTEKQNIFWLMCLQSTGQVIGSICLWNFSDDYKTAELGYELHPDFQSLGYMNEAMTTVIQFSFSKLELNALEAFTHGENKASKKMLSKHGFKRDKERIDQDVPENEIFILSNQY